MTQPVTIAARTLELLARPGLRVRPLLPALVLGALGWALDRWLGAPAPGAALAIINIWVALAVMVVSAVLSYALAPKAPQPPKPTLEDFDFPTAEEGRAVPVVFGEVWITGPNMLWYGDLVTTPIKVKGGKK